PLPTSFYSPLSSSASFSTYFHTLSLHDALPISLEFLRRSKALQPDIPTKSSLMVGVGETHEEIYETMDDLRANDVDILTIGQYLDRKSTRLNSSHVSISYAVFCLKIKILVRHVI